MNNRIFRLEKLLVFMSAIFLATGSLNAQKKGQFVLQAEANAGILFCHPYQGSFNSIDLEAAVGPVFRYQVTDCLGVGIGANYCVHHVLQYLPVFADAIYSFGSCKAKPYAEIRVGYAFSLKQTEPGYNGDLNRYTVEGGFSQLIIGCSNGHSDFGIGGQLVNLKDEGIEWTFLKNLPKLGLFLHYAYNFHFGEAKQ